MRRLLLDSGRRLGNISRPPRPARHDASGEAAAAGGVRWIALVVFLYANYIAMIGLALLLFVTVSFRLLPAVLTGSLPSWRVGTLAVVIPPLMLLMAAICYYPEIRRMALKRPPSEETELLTSAAGSYVNSLVFTLGAMFISVLVGLPIRLAFALADR
jgi:hypothetical protein